MSIKDELIFDFDISLPRVMICGGVIIIDYVKRIAGYSAENILLHNGERYTCVTGKNLVLKEMPDQSYAYTYYSNGAIATEIEKQANGFTRERHYYENGIVSREYELWDDSTYRDNYFDQNGNITQANFKNGVGGVEERTFRPDGTSYGYYYDPSGPIFYYEFDASGRQLLDTHRQIN